MAKFEPIQLRGPKLNPLNPSACFGFQYRSLPFTQRCSSYSARRSAPHMLGGHLGGVDVHEHVHVALYEDWLLAVHLPGRASGRRVLVVTDAAGTGGRRRNDSWMQASISVNSPR